MDGKFSLTSKQMLHYKIRRDTVYALVAAAIAAFSFYAAFQPNAGIFRSWFDAGLGVIGVWFSGELFWSATKNSCQLARLEDEERNKNI